MLFLSIILVSLPSPLQATEITEASTPENQDRGYKLVDDTVQVHPTPYLQQDVYILSAKGQYDIIPSRNDENNQLSIFCYSSVLSISLFWSSTSMKMDMPSNDYRV